MHICKRQPYICTPSSNLKSSIPQWHKINQWVTKTHPITYSFTRLLCPTVFFWSFIRSVFSAVPYWICKVASPFPPKSWHFIYALTNMPENKDRFPLISFTWKDRCRSNRDMMRGTLSFQPFVSSSQFCIFRFAYYSFITIEMMNQYGVLVLQILRVQDLH